VVSKKQKYESRQDVEQRLVNTTFDLLLDHSPEDLTLRQIAVASKCHHPNIVNYFGNKSGLFEAVFPLVVQSIVQSNIPASFTEPTKELIRLVRLAAWLENHSENYFARQQQRPIIDTLVSIYIQRFKVSETDAHLLSQRLIASIMSAILHRPSINLQIEDFKKHFELEIRIARLLGSETSAQDS
jgi:AcrR family transcriptional regulator